MVSLTPTCSQKKYTYVYMLEMNMSSYNVLIVINNTQISVNTDLKDGAKYWQRTKFHLNISSRQYPLNAIDSLISFCEPQESKTFLSTNITKIQFMNFVESCRKQHMTYHVIFKLLARAKARVNDQYLYLLIGGTIRASTLI